MFSKITTLPLAIAASTYLLAPTGFAAPEIEEPKLEEPATGALPWIDDFRGEREEIGWQAVNDGVMGGLSEGGPIKHDDFLRFSGNLSLENNGGFSLIRRSVDLDLSEASGVRLLVRGDGRTYQFRFQTNARLQNRWAVSFSGAFETKKDEWVEVVVPFSELSQSFRGYQFDNYTFDPKQIERLGIILADKKPGPFQLDIAWIAPEPIETALSE